MCGFPGRGCAHCILSLGILSLVPSSHVGPEARIVVALFSSAVSMRGGWRDRRVRVSRVCVFIGLGFDVIDRETPHALFSSLVDCRR